MVCLGFKPWGQDGRRRRIHWALSAPQFNSFFVCDFRRESPKPKNASRAWRARWQQLRRFGTGDIKSLTYKLRPWFGIFGIIVYSLQYFVLANPFVYFGKICSIAVDRTQVTLMKTTWLIWYIIAVKIGRIRLRSQNVAVVVFKVGSFIFDASPVDNIRYLIWSN